MKTNELSGWQLDYATSKALGHMTIVVPHHNNEGASVYANQGLRQAGIPFRPSKELGRAMEIVQPIGGFELKIWLESSSKTKYEAHIHNHFGDFIAFGENMAQACLRVFVMMKLGEEFEIPSIESFSPSPP